MGVICDWTTKFLEGRADIGLLALYSKTQQLRDNKSASQVLMCQKINPVTVLVFFQLHYQAINPVHFCYPHFPLISFSWLKSFFLYHPMHCLYDHSHQREVYCCKRRTPTKAIFFLGCLLSSASSVEHHAVNGAA